MLKYSLVQSCLNVWKQFNVQKVEWSHSRCFKYLNYLFKHFNLNSFSISYTSSKEKFPNLIWKFFFLMKNNTMHQITKSQSVPFFANSQMLEDNRMALWKEKSRLMQLMGKSGVLWLMGFPFKDQNNLLRERDSINLTRNLISIFLNWSLRNVSSSCHTKKTQDY